MTIRPQPTKNVTARAAYFVGWGLNGETYLKDKFFDIIIILIISVLYELMKVRTKKVVEKFGGIKYLR